MNRCRAEACFTAIPDGSTYCIKHTETRSHPMGRRVPSSEIEPLRPERDAVRLVAATMRALGVKVVQIDMRHLADADAELYFEPTTPDGGIRLSLKPLVKTCPECQGTGRVRIPPKESE